MKKLFMLTAIAALSMNLTFAQNSSSDSGGIHFGAKAGVNFASVSDDDNWGDVDGRTGFHIGAVVNIGISEKFSIQPEVVYSSQGYTYTESDYKGTGKIDYINVPVMAGFMVVDGLVLQAGPQFGINITAKETYDDGDDDFDFKDEVQTVDIGLGFGAQFTLDFGLFFQARYTLGLNNIISDDDYNTDIKNRVASLSVGYFFN